MEKNLVESIFEAITIGDEVLLKDCMQQATIDTVLEFRRSYGESPLHLCVKIGDMSHLGVVRCLLASGLTDSTTVDSEGHTALEWALANRADSELVDALIKVEIDGIDDATACYKMLRHDSLQLFKKFLLIKQFKEEKEFEHIASALIQLNVKNVHLSEDLRLYLLWKLSDYGFRNLSGKWLGTEDPNEWKNHIDIISKCWYDLNEQYNTRLYTDIDDLFLHRLLTVHNHLDFLMFKQFLAHLPMQEVRFCVAIFLSIYRNPEQFQEYRLMINKCLVMEFLHMVCDQLAKVKTYLEETKTKLLSIVQKIETFGTVEKNKLIEELLEKLDSSNLPNKAHVMQQLKERVKITSATCKDTLIKDMLDKVKKIDRPWTEKMAEKVKALEKTNREQLIVQIGKRLRHVSHPQNVVNRLMGDWKKGKPTESIVADIVSGESFNLSHLMCKNDRRINRKLTKCYSKTKQYYSLKKTVFYCENIVSSSPEAKQSTYDEMACMKRTVQVFGEAIKNTANSANLPAKAGKALNGILSLGFPIASKSYREVFSHSMSLKRQLLGDKIDKWVFQAFRSNYNNMRMAVQLLYVAAIEEVWQTFYGYMRQCDTFRELRSLLLYAGDMEALKQRQLTCYQRVVKYYDEAIATFKQLAKEPIGKMPNIRQVHERLKLQWSIVNELSVHFDPNDAFNFREIRNACCSGDDLPTVRRLLDWKLTNGWAGEFFQKLSAWWKNDDSYCLTPQCNDKRFLKYYPEISVGILENGFIIMQAIEEFEYIVYTRQLTQDLEIADKIDEEALQQLNRRLNPYYNDIFFIDNKWKVLETFCKERKLVLNKKLTRKLVERDQTHLQQLYHSSRKQLLDILTRYGLHTVDGLVTRLNELPTPMISAIEHIQLELCEMLYAVGYFGQNFHYLKSRIPMIQGKNYRNFLAHDALSSNLLTDSSKEKIIINAFVFATTEVRLFGNSGSNMLDIKVPTLSETDQWVDLQKRLLEAFKAKDLQEMHKLRQTGGEMKARFCCTPNSSYLASSFFQLSELINPCNPDDAPVVEYLDQHFGGFLELCNDPEYQVSMALKLRDFQAVYDRTIARGDRVIREELFHWQELMANVRQTDLFVHLVANDNIGAVLKKLIEHGNTAGVREILPYFENLHTANNRSPLGDALLYCVRSVAQLLLPLSLPDRTILVLAIIVHQNDIFEDMMAKADIDKNTFACLLKASIQARNDTTAEHLLQNKEFINFIPDAFVNCCETAAAMGEKTILQQLLVRCPTASIVNDGLATILHQACLKQRWNCVRLLLKHDVPVDAANYQSALHFALLSLVKHGQRRLLRSIKYIQHEAFGMVTAHPLTVAVTNGTASRRMIWTLRTLGFEWLDSSTTLHAAIQYKNRKVFKTIKKRVDNYCALDPSAQLDHFRHALIVLRRWKMISFVEETKDPEFASLYYAFQTENIKMAEELLSWARQMRTIEELGILGGIVFERESVYTCFGKKWDGSWIGNTRDSCQDMIVPMETCAMLGEMIWQQFTVNAQSSTQVTFNVLTTEDEVFEPLPNPTFTLRDSASLEENLKDFLTFVNAHLNNFTIIFAKFTTSGAATRYFWQIEQISCMYDVVSPSARGVDLTDMINYRNKHNETLLHHCVRKYSVEVVKLLVDNGANPLLTDSTGMSSIAFALVGSKDYAIAHYLLDECVRRDLRNELGCTVLEYFNPISGDSLIHTAIMVARQDIVQWFLQHHVNVWVENNDGCTPAQLAGSIRLYNVCSIVKMILDYDASQIDKLDKANNSLLQCAVTFNLTKMVELVLQYKPNLLLRRNGMTALGMAILLKHIDCAKCILNYAIENNIREITRADESDHVLSSLFCNDYDLSRMLLEYELGHTLEETDERDLPRIKSILQGSMQSRPDVLMATVVRVHRYTEAQKFREELEMLADSIQPN